MSDTNKLKIIGSNLQDIFARIYRSGIPLQDSLQYYINWVGDKNGLIGAVAISLIIALISFSLFAFFFACFFSVIVTVVVFIVAKMIFYKPIEYSIELEDEDTLLSFVKDIDFNGASEVAVHSQPESKLEDGKNKNTYVVLQLFNSVSILDCRNITSVSDKSYRDIQINFFHPAKDEYKISATSEEGNVVFEVLHQNDEQCRIKFMDPVRNKVKVKLNFNPPAKVTG